MAGNEHNACNDDDLNREPRDTSDSFKSSTTNKEEQLHLHPMCPLDHYFSHQKDMVVPHAHIW